MCVWCGVWSLFTRVAVVIADQEVWCVVEVWSYRHDDAYENIEVARVRKRQGQPRPCGHWLAGQGWKEIVSHADAILQRWKEEKKKAKKNGIEALSAARGIITVQIDVIVQEDIKLCI